MTQVSRFPRRTLHGLVVLAVVAIVGLTGFLLRGLEQQVEQSSRTEFANFARVFEEHVRRIARAGDSSLQVLRAALPPDVARFDVAQWSRGNPLPVDITAQIGVIDAGGIFVGSNLPTFNPASRLDLSDREHFRVHRDGDGEDRLFISKPVLGRATGKWTIQLTRRIAGPDNGFGGVVVLSLEVDYFSRFYDSIDIGRTGCIMLIGLDGVVRASARGDNKPLQIGEDISHSRLFERFSAIPLGSFIERGPTPAEDTLLAYRRITGLPLAVVLGNQASDHLRAYSEKRPMILAVAGVAIALIVAMAIALDRMLVRAYRAQDELIAQRLAHADAQASERVRMREDQRFRAATESAHDAILTWDSDGRLLQANASARRLFSLRVDLDQLRIGDLVSPEHLLALAGMGGDGNAPDGELSIRRPDGVSVLLEVSLNRWQGDDGLCTTMIARDISQRRRAEEERQTLVAHAMQSQKMEAIGTLAGGIAHDFNNVLGAMQGFMWLARRDAPADSRMATYIDKAVAAGERATRVVKQLLDYSRAQAGVAETFDLRSLIRELSELAPATIPATLTCAFEPGDVPLPVHADATKVHQVLLNLVVNAVQAIGEGRIGRINLRSDARQVSGDIARGARVPAGDLLPLVKSELAPDGQGGRLLYGALAAGTYAVVRISDSGCGMSAEVMQRIFEPFFSTKPVGEGTGLGLSVLHGVVKALGGGMVVESRVDRGTTFEILLPLAATEAVAVAPAQMATMPSTSGRILLVDDEADLLAIGRTTLEAAGFEVTTAPDGLAALSLVQADPRSWTLVITDLTMPRMAGDQLATAIRSIRTNLPVVICTGRSDKVESLRDNPAISIVAKPIYGRKLVDAVQAALAAPRRS